MHGNEDHMKVNRYFVVCGSIGLASSPLQFIEFNVNSKSGLDTLAVMGGIFFVQDGVLAMTERRGLTFAEPDQDRNGRYS